MVDPVLQGCLEADMVVNWVLPHQIPAQPLGLLQVIYLNFLSNLDEDRSPQVLAFHNSGCLAAPEGYLLRPAGFLLLRVHLSDLPELHVWRMHAVVSLVHMMLLNAQILQFALGRGRSPYVNRRVFSADSYPTVMHSASDACQCIAKNGSRLLSTYRCRIGLNKPVRFGSTSSASR